MNLFKLVIATLGLLLAAVDVDAAEPAPKFQVPGACVQTIEIVAGKVKQSTRCEYTPEQLERLRKIGK